MPGPGRRFKPGQSGNPAGRKVGSKNRKTLIMEELSRDGSALATAIKAKALDGDAGCLSLWLSRLEPPLRARAETVVFELDPNKSLIDQAQQILTAIADGRIDPETGAMLMNCIKQFADVKAVEELESRLVALENKA